jgi:hypothetical protein
VIRCGIIVHIYSVQLAINGIELVEQTARSNFYRDPISSVLLSEDEIVYSTVTTSPAMTKTIPSPFPWASIGCASIPV